MPRQGLFYFAVVGLVLIALLAGLLSLRLVWPWPPHYDVALIAAPLVLLSVIGVYLKNTHYFERSWQLAIGPDGHIVLRALLDAREYLPARDCVLSGTPFLGEWLLIFELKDERAQMVAVRMLRFKSNADDFRRLKISLACLVQRQAIV